MSSWAELFEARFTDADVPSLVDDRGVPHVWFDMNPSSKSNYRGEIGDDLYVDPPDAYFGASLVLTGTRLSSTVQLEMGTEDVIPGHKPVRLRKELERSELDDIIRKLQVLRATMDVAEEFAVDKNVELYRRGGGEGKSEKEDKAGPRMTGEKSGARPPNPT